MKIFPQNIIPQLTDSQLLSLHKCCCALRGEDWHKVHSPEDYVFSHPYGWLVAYHKIVMDEMDGRGYYPVKYWYIPGYRGEDKEELSGEEYVEEMANYWEGTRRQVIYPEHE